MALLCKTLKIQNRAAGHNNIGHDLPRRANNRLISSMHDKEG